jgi:hypothetical protein
MDDNLKPGSPELAYGRALPYHAAFFQDQGVYMYASLEIVHAIPWNPGNDVCDQYHLAVVMLLTMFAVPQHHSENDKVRLTSGRYCWKHGLAVCSVS